MRSMYLGTMCYSAGSCVDRVLPEIDQSDNGQGNIDEPDYEHSMSSDADDDQNSEIEHPDLCDIMK